MLGITVPMSSWLIASPCRGSFNVSIYIYYTHINTASTHLCTGVNNDLGDLKSVKISRMLYKGKLICGYLLRRFKMNEATPFEQ